MKTKEELLKQWKYVEHEMATNESMAAHDFHRLYGWKEAIEWMLEENDG